MVPAPSRLPRTATYPATTSRALARARVPWQTTVRIHVVRDRAAQAALARGSDAGDIGGEEVDAVSVEVAAGPVVVLGGAWVGVAGQDLGVPQRDAGV